MWDNPKLLNWIANLLFALSMVAILYAVLYAVVHLPIFPLREVKIDGQLNHVSREQVKLIVSKHLKGNFFNSLHGQFILYIKWENNVFLILITSSMKMVWLSISSTAKADLKKTGENVALKTLIGIFTNKSIFTKNVKFS